jgi:hypothetical protein
MMLVVCIDSYGAIYRSQEPDYGLIRVCVGNLAKANDRLLI